MIFFLVFRFPWGNDTTGAMDGTRCPKLHSHNNTLPPAAKVTDHPTGASFFGVLDMVGNVWQYTDEFEDLHTRAAIVRGGSFYYPSVPKGVNWYFPNPPQARHLGTHGKYMLMSDSYERAGTVGFRCAADAT